MKSKRTLINEQIKRLRIQQVRVVVDNSAEIMSLSEALQVAENKGLDLVCVSPDGNPPVCKVMDFGKYQYTQRKKHGKKQKEVSLKEIKLRPVTDDHDLEHKIKKVREFLEDGDKVKLTVRFRGREFQFKNQASERLNRIIEAVSDIGKVSSLPKLLGRNMIAILESGKSKTKSTRTRVEKP